MLCVLGVLLATPALASATTRYAAPGGTAADTVCTSPTAAPCSINTAAAGPDVMAADEVVIAPGDYSDTAGDLGPNDYVDPVANNVHGEVGQPRPVITLDELGNGGFGAFKVESGNTISHIEIDTSAAETNINLAGGVVDDLIAHSSQNSGPIVCKFTGSATLRDSACISSGDQARTVGSFLTGSATTTVTLRNVTAFATGALNGNAIDFAATDTHTLTVDAKSVLGQATGVGSDLYTEEYMSASVTLNLDHSNYSSQGAQGTPTVNTTNHQLAEPALASDMVHQLPSSVTVNAGATDGSSGSTDIDGQNRTIGGTVDIGADELGLPTTTDVSCDPTSIPAGRQTTCTATVVTSTGGGTPQGTVEFSSDTPGGVFIPSPTCMLSVAGEDGSSCQVTYNVGSGAATQGITAAYGGDTTHDGSVDYASNLLQVFLSAPPPPLFTGPTAAPPTTKKCKKKRHHSAAAAKKKCKKKKRR